MAHNDLGEIYNTPDQASWQNEDTREGGEQIAVIGMAGRFPGAKNCDELWRNLRDGVEGIRFFSEEELLANGISAEQCNRPGYVKAAPVLEDVGAFDAGFFGYTPREAELLDPQQRLFLEVVWEALENAGFRDGEHNNTTGLFAGSGLSHYLMNHLRERFTYDEAGFETLIGNDKDYLCTRVAYKLNLGGPAVNIQTACSSSLVAVHAACQSLIGYECDLAVAGGVTVRLPGVAGYQYQEGGLFSPDGHCRPFDAEARGTLFGSGVGAVILKRLSEARDDGDPIRAVILASAVNNDGSRKVGFTAPSEIGQLRVLAEALELAEVAPETIGYIEAHGTGTALGDPIEAAALKQAFPKSGDDHRCALGSIKSNIGHLENAAGIAGFIKTVLVLEHGQIPPTLHFKQLNPMIRFEDSPFFVADHLQPWPMRGVRRAGVSSFGIGGTNAHVLLEQSPAPVIAHEADRDAALILPLSARSETSLHDLAAAYHDLLVQQERPLSWSRLAFNAATRRNHHHHRLAVFARNRRQAADALAAFQRGEKQQNAASGKSQRDAEPRVVFVFPGQGSQWPNMAADLYQTYPVYREAYDACDRLFHNYRGFSLRDQCEGTQAAAALERVDLVQPALFAVAYALAQLWRSLGIEPAAVIGHSQGEVVAACIAGSLRLEDAMLITCERSRLVAGLKNEGRMAVVEIDAESCRRRLADYGDGATVAAVNSPRSCVIAGRRAVVEALVAEWEQEGRYARLVDVSYAGHSAHVESVLYPLQDRLASIQPTAGTIPLISTVDGGSIDGQNLDAAYWSRNLREPVRFYDALSAAFSDPYTHFLEVSPHPILQHALRDSLQECRRRFPIHPPAQVLATLKRDEVGPDCLLEQVAAGYAAGLNPRWEQLFPLKSAAMPLPGYPWHHRRYWIEAASAGQDGGALATNSHRFNHALFKAALTPAGGETHRLWQAKISLETMPYLVDHGVAGMAIVPAAFYLEAAREAGAQLFEGAVPILRDLTFGSPFFLHEGRDYLLQMRAEQRGPRRFAIFICSSPRDEDHWVEHVQGLLETEAAPLASALQTSLEEARQHCRQSHDVKAFYQQQEQRGLFYGEAFRGIDTLLTGANEALAHIQPTAAVTTESNYGIHPALFDACLQSLLACRDPQSDDDTLYLPYAVHQVLIEIHPRGDFWVHARLETTQPGSREVVGHLCGYDSDGALLFRLDHLRFRAADLAGEQDSLLYQLHWTTVAPLLHGEPSGSDGAWLMFADEAGEAERLLQALANHGQTGYLVRRSDSFSLNATSAAIDPDSNADWSRLWEALSSRKWRGILYLWAIDAPKILRRDSAAFEAATALSGRTLIQLTNSLLDAVDQRRFQVLPLTLFTQGAFPERTGAEDCQGCPFQAPLWSTAAVLNQEHPAFQTRCLDLESLPREVEGEDRRSRDQEHEQLVFEVLYPDNENRVKYRANQRYAQRLVHYEKPPFSEQPHQWCRPDAARLVVEALEPGNLATVRPVRYEIPTPSDDEVLIAVRAAGLNFLDLLGAMGQRPDLDQETPKLGAECAGTVVALGPPARGFSVGQPVFALANPAFASFALVPQNFVRALPAGLEPNQAATMLIAPLTATVALRHLARLQPGESVLIHSAASGTGLAAFQLARALGATIYATAGTPEKRAYLLEQGAVAVADSRTPDFAEQFRAHSGGRGIDVVLNALSGDLMRAGLELTAAYGRFVEIGKRDIYENQSLGLLPFQRNLSYTALDLARWMEDRPEVVARCIDQVCEDINQGIFRPQPLQAYPLAQVDQALAALGQARHVGKLVLTFDKNAVEAVAPKPSFTIREDGLYWITGGTGGLGLVFARHLADLGARHIWLLSRRGQLAEAVRQEFNDRGVHLRVIGADLSDDHQVSTCLNNAKQTGIPLRGILHAAGVVADQAWRESDHDAYTKVMAAKAKSAWHLHRFTADTPLDFTLYFSSTAAFNGTPGQAAYAAANGFLDALADYRHSLGLPALSINWGGWRDVGLAADQLQGTAARFGISPAEGKAVLNQLFAEPPLSQVIATKTPLPPWLINSRKQQPLFSLLNSNTSTRSRGSEQITARLDAAPREERAPIVEHYLAEQLSDVLRFPVTQISPDVGLNEYGLSSLFALEMRNRIEQDLEMSIPVVWFFQAGTIRALAERLLEARTLATLVTDDQTPAEEEEADGWDELTL